jgi:hypothetical protein
VKPGGARRVLSSGSTWSYKYFWPWFTGVAFLGATILLWRLPLGHNGDAIWLGRFAIPFIGMGSTAYGFWYGGRLKHVEMNDEGLYVRSRGREIYLPFSAIDTCEVNWELRNRRSSTPMVIIQLRTGTALGPDVRFVAALP